MKIQVRNSIFETNSSSVHSVTVCDKSDYIDWTNGKKKFNPYKEDFLDNAEADKYNIENKVINDFNYDGIFIDSDYRNPDIIDFILGNIIVNNRYDMIDAYLTYERYFTCAEYITDNFERIVNYEENKIEFGYEGYR